MDIISSLSAQVIAIFSSAALAAALVSALLIYLSLRDHTRTGPRVKEEITRHYARYAFFSLSRLGAWCFVISFFLATIGASLYLLTIQTWGLAYSFPLLLFTSMLGIALISAYLFCHYLLYTPSLLVSSARFRFSRLTPLWRQLSPRALGFVRWFFLLLIATMLIGGIYQMLLGGQWAIAIFYALQSALYLYFFAWVTDFLSTFDEAKTSVGDSEQSAPDSSDKTPSTKQKTLPNILMIGADTLRADRLGTANYIRNLSPNIDKLAEQSVSFTNCYTPLARTAPSLASIFTGTWPHKHGIRTNYPYANQLNLPVDNLIETLNKAGYNTAAIADWAGADLGKIKFGFKQLNLPQDQWNLKYLIRQGPASIRFFLSLFCHNRFGKKFLPELYYLAGIPLSKQLFSDTRSLISAMATNEQPFCINVFTASTHVPFGSNYPYYNLFTPDNYSGDSQFIMTKLATPEEVVEKQELGPEAFDVPQILNLYDGCVVQFDDEVGKLLAHLKTSGLADKTIVVIYSDHGADFFETGSWGQGNTLIGNDPSGRVPLIIHDPRVLTSQTVDQTVRTIDIVPTLLELLGLPPIPGIDGESLVKAMREPSKSLDLLAYQETGLWLGRVPGAHPKHLYYPNLLELLDIPNKNTGMFSIKQQYYYQVVEAKDRSVRNDRWKLVAIPTEEGVLYQLFDMQVDPACSKDLASSEVETFNKLKIRLEQLIAEDTLLNNTRVNLSQSLQHNQDILAERKISDA